MADTEMQGDGAGLGRLIQLADQIRGEAVRLRRAAASTLPPAEERARLARHIEAFAEMHSIGGREWQRGMRDAAQLLRRDDFAPAPEVTHYPDDGHQGGAR